MTLKCWLGNLDGISEGLIVETSKARAAKVLRTSLNHFNLYWGEVSLPHWAKLGVLYTKRYDSHSPWREEKSWQVR
jgi:hypothetical protein